MKQTHVAFAIVAIFGIASMLPQDALAQPTPRQPFESLRMEWQQDKEVLQENRIEERQARVADRLENRATRREVRADIQERAWLRIASSTDTVRAQFVGEKKDAVESRLRSMYSRFDGVINRLDALADKIEDRIAVAEQEGTDVTAATAALSDARTQIDDAAAIVASTQVAITDALAQDATLSRDGLRELVVEAANAIRAARQSLADVITHLKAPNA